MACRLALVAAVDRRMRKEVPKWMLSQSRELIRRQELESPRVEIHQRHVEVLQMIFKSNMLLSIGSTNDFEELILMMITLGRFFRACYQSVCFGIYPDYTSSVI